MTQALVAAPVILAAVLAGAGAAKLRDDDARVALEWDLMRVPERLNRRWLRRSHPWIEILLAGMLLVSTGVLGVLAACAALALCVAYTSFVLQAMKVPGAVCNCFGSGRATVLSRRTVLRNGLLVLLAVLAVISTASQGTLLTQALADPSVVAWAGAVLVAMVVAYLVADSGGVGDQTPDGPSAVVSPNDHSDAASEPEDYVRTLTPRATVREEDGTPVDLYRVSQRQAQLLLFVAPGCGHCEVVAARIDEWVEAMPPLGIHFVVAGTVAQLKDRRPEWVKHAWYDYDRAAAHMLQCDATPSAVLLGTDGMLAGGPVSGDVTVLDFVEEIRQQLEA
ncbi:MauE/DoxX family redox-associated membrane protein [Actinomyces faecalis]|uniref:MauE/DoxX family redox-associated membrane protein n=1 Tax=Actinomyces faecalis TaxID=2722820 RepID=UPI0015518433|nr:MauE/DoxX family redox-associated membrane protein [Actinomyces faecalis]